MKPVYLTQEALKALEKIKENDSEFNFSNFVQEAIINHNQTGKLLDGDLINSKLNHWKGKLEESENNIRYWEEKEKEFRVQQEIMKQKEEEQKSKAQREYEKEKEKENNIKNTFKEEMGRIMEDFEYQEYLKEGGNIWAFCDMLKERIDDKNQ